MKFKLTSTFSTLTDPRSIRNRDHDFGAIMGVSLVDAEEPTLQINSSQVDKFLVKKSPAVGVKFGSKNSLAF
jgi:hypothetical protein